MRRGARIGDGARERARRARVKVGKRVFFVAGVFFGFLVVVVVVVVVVVIRRQHGFPQHVRDLQQLLHGDAVRGVEALQVEPRPGLLRENLVDVLQETHAVRLRADVALHDGGFVVAGDQKLEAVRHELEVGRAEALHGHHARVTERAHALGEVCAGSHRAVGRNLRSVMIHLTRASNEKVPFPGRVPRGATAGGADGGLREPRDARRGAPVAARAERRGD